jgi:hypothetical protein
MRVLLSSCFFAFGLDLFVVWKLEFVGLAFLGRIL